LETHPFVHFEEGTMAAKMALGTAFWYAHGA
jgi:hypothetical protein